MKDTYPQAPALLDQQEVIGTPSESVRVLAFNLTIEQKLVTGAVITVDSRRFGGEGIQIATDGELGELGIVTEKGSLLISQPGKSPKIT